MGKYESPEYTVKMKEGPFEIRAYKAFYIIEYESSVDPDVDAAFGTLFRYIRSNNDQHEKINMTIPVIKAFTPQGMKMAFVVPKEKWDHIPRPNDPRLTIRQFEEGVFAVITYSGRSTGDKEKMKTTELLQWIKDHQYEHQSHAMVAIYNGPYVPPFLRKNEVMVRIGT